ncbi:hypothetical protein [Ensifer sp. 1H6]|uniref:hypothetical protein n=1 Tax=Ensifer sp. 1H6 TaxID=1911585 RepID=UPI0009C59D8C|nr:hypothetical protein [Ensifer sp. 1H6]OMQ42042.1 hypothetical protein BKP54_25195 [Ensifer sp. 1H6]
MEKKSGFLEKLKQGKCKDMSDVATANYLIRSIGGGGRVGDILFEAAGILKKLFPHKGDPKKQWTERRLKAWWNNETDVVRHWQMMELYAAAEAVKDENELLRAARREHADFIEKTSRIRALAELAETDGHRGGA